MRSNNVYILRMSRHAIVNHFEAFFAKPIRFGNQQTSSKPLTLLLPSTTIFHLQLTCPADHLFHSTWTESGQGDICALEPVAASGKR